MSVPTLLTSMVSSFVDYAVTQGVSRTRLLSVLQTTEAALAHPDGRIPASAYRAAQTLAINESGDTGLPMRHAASTDGDKLSVVSLIVANAGSLENAIAQLNRYTRIVADIPLSEDRPRFELVTDAHGAWLLDRLPLALGGSSGIEVTLTNFLIGNRRHSKPPVPVKEVWLQFPEPPHRALYDAVFDAPIRFEMDRNGFLLKPGWDDPWSRASSEYAHGLFAKHADVLLFDLNAQDALLPRVEAEILADLSSGLVTIDRVADRIGLSRRTLHRRLQAEGVTFTEVVDGLRYRLARDQLVGHGASIAEIAYLLGYSEASTFVRAFKRWSGKTPSTFRAESETS